MIKLLAVFVTLVASAMTATAAWDRGGTLLDKALLVSMSVVIVLAVHFLPALSRRPVSWLIWFGCLLCAVYGHLTFLTHASLRAGDAQAQHSSLTVGTERQITLTQDALAQIKARPVSVVADELAKATTRKERAALKVEINEGKRAAGLRDGLIKLSGASTEAQVTGAADPVTAKLAEFFGVGDSVVAVSIGLTFSILLELIGALVWVEALRPSNSVLVKVEEVSEAVTRGVTPVTLKPVTRVTDSVTEVVTFVTPDVNSHVTIEPESRVTDSVTSHVTQSADIEESHGLVAELKLAIDTGKCKPTVTSIQEFLSIARAKAAELRRLLKVQFSI